jgi:hypothetical protein
MSTILSRNATMYISSVDLDLVASSSTTVSKLNIVNPSINTSSEKDVQSIGRITGEAGTRTYIKKISPTSLKFETYMKIDAAGDPADSILWNSLTGAYTNAGDPAVSDYSSFNITAVPYLFILLDLGDAVFKFTNCLIESCNITMKHTDIVKVEWSVKTLGFDTYAGTMPVLFSERTESANFLKAKASVVSVSRDAIAYSLPLLETSVSIKNVIKHLHGNEYNSPLSNPGRMVLTGREIKGKLKCYLRTGNSNSLGLLSTMINSPANINDLLSNITLDLGGTSGKRLTLEAPYSVVSWPSTNLSSVLDVTFDFFIQGTSLGANDDLTVKFYR